LAASTKGNTKELVVVQRRLMEICSASMVDAVFLSGNRRGVGAMKIARGMFEIHVIAEYLAKNPTEVDDYLNFSTVEAWRHLQTAERHRPGLN
jgi:hypothetical protein